MDSAYRNLGVVRQSEYSELSQDSKRQVLLRRIDMMADTIARNAFLPPGSDAQFLKMALRAAVRITLAACLDDHGRTIYRKQDTHILDSDMDWVASLSVMANEGHTDKETPNGDQSPTKNLLQASVPTIPVEAAPTTESGGSERPVDTRRGLQRSDDGGQPDHILDPSTGTREFTR